MRKNHLVICFLILVLSILTGCGKQVFNSNNTNPSEPFIGTNNLNDSQTKDQSQPTDPVDIKSIEDLPENGYYIITVSINPEVKLYVSYNTQRVLFVDCMNADAEQLLSIMDVNLIGMDYKDSVKTLVVACAEQKYLTEENNDILIEANTSSVDVAEIPEEYAANIQELVEEIQDSVSIDIEMEIPCPYCNGTGICEVCHGNKQMICDVCQGTSITPCDECKGELTVPCHFCEGNLIMGEKYTCIECNGQGTWSCTDCGGTGKITCPTCGGNGRNNCDHCHNTGTQTCLKCNGAGCYKCNYTGIMECTYCHGHSVDGICPQCDGTGEQYCNPCRGEGFIICNACNGTGIVDNTYTCPTCNGTGRETCPCCHGTNQTPCYGCSGTGYKSCYRCDGTGICPSCHGEKVLAGHQ